MTDPTPDIALLCERKCLPIPDAHFPRDVGVKAGIRGVWRSMVYTRIYTRRQRPVGPLAGASGDAAPVSLSRQIRSSSPSFVEQSGEQNVGIGG